MNLSDSKYINVLLRSCWWQSPELPGTFPWRNSYCHIRHFANWLQDKCLGSTYTVAQWPRTGKITRHVDLSNLCVLLYNKQSKNYIPNSGGQASKNFGYIESGVKPYLIPYNHILQHSNEAHDPKYQGLKFPSAIVQ